MTNPTEKKIQAFMATRFGKTGSICVPNCSAFGWESDLLRLTPHWLCAEYEIKISRADFRADAKKVWRDVCLARRPAESPADCPNYFWYAAPRGVIPVDEVPQHAGLLEIHDFKMHVVKRAPRLHKTPIAGRRAAYIMRGVAMRYWERRYAEVRFDK